MAKNVPQNLAKKLRSGTYGLDVVRVRKPDGTHTYKLVELNPAAGSGESQFLDPTVNPLLSQDVYKWVTGKDAPLIIGMKALGVGAPLAGTGYLAS